jgi:hypothetical protein
MKRKKKPIKINTNWTQDDVEDLAAEMEIHGYQKHWFESTQTGWQIRIATDNELFKINCHFADRVRTSNGRLLKK